MCSLAKSGRVCSHMALARISYWGPGSRGPRPRRAWFKKASISSSVVTSRSSTLRPQRSPYIAVCVVVIEAPSGVQPGGFEIEAVVHRGYEALQLVGRNEDGRLRGHREHPRLVDGK